MTHRSPVQFSAIPVLILASVTGCGGNDSGSVRMAGSAGQSTVAGSAANA